MSYRQRMPEKDYFALVRKLGEEFTKGRKSFQSHGSTPSRRSLPEWMNEDRKLASFLQRTFPKAFSDPHQYKTMARWAYIIYRYQREGISSGVIAHEISSRHTDGGYQNEKGEVIPPPGAPREEVVTAKQIQKIIEHVKNLTKGLRQNGAQHTRGRAGRPAGIHTPWKRSTK
jgi:hypothetical protein